MTNLAREGTAAVLKKAPGVALDGAVAAAAEAATRYLLARQSPEGYWAGELEADTTLESDYILLQLWLHPPGAEGRWKPPSGERVQAAARYILSRQHDDGGWNLYPSGPANVSASVKAYFALKLAGLGPDDLRMRRARERILKRGGVEAANSYTKIYLSYFGLYDRAKVPTIPPELFLLPPTAPFNIYEMSSWTRAILAPLAILGAKKTQRAVPAGFTLAEIYSGAEPLGPDFLSWRNFFMWVDRALKIWEHTGFQPAREKAVAAAAEWMIAHLRESDGLGAIFPAMMNSIMALSELGYTLDDPLLRREVEKFEELMIEERAPAAGDAAQNGHLRGENGNGNGHPAAAPVTLRMQPCFSPVWDTALTCYAVGSANPGNGEAVARALRKAADWLLSKEVRNQGDWAVKNKNAEPGGWYFEFANEFYPDTDDTAKVLLALEFARASDPRRQSEAERRAAYWLLSMQSRDGGWAAFDVDNDSQILTHVPFADHNAMLDPTCADITGRVLEALCRFPELRQHPAIARGVKYLKRNQEDDGSWYGRWGVNYIYGSCFALRGLIAAGEDPHEAYIIRATEFLRSVQNAGGGWGETCASYDDPSWKTAGESTPSQTAWALLGLFASGDYRTTSVEDGVRYLIETQKPDGSWQEDFYTGTGFPCVFYLKYHLYGQYFPLMALGKYQNRPRAV